MLSERKQEEEGKMVSNDDDNFGVICLEEEWGVAHLDLLPKKKLREVFGALPR